MRQRLDLYKPHCEYQLSVVLSLCINKEYICLGFKQRLVAKDVPSPVYTNRTNDYFRHRKESLVTKTCDSDGMTCEELQ